MVSQTLIKHFDATRMANADSMREGGWSTPTEIKTYKDYVGLKDVSSATLDQLVKMKYLQKKSNLYRYTEAGILFFQTQAGGGNGGGIGGGSDSPPGQNGDLPGDDNQWPPKPEDQGGPLKGDDQYDPKYPQGQPKRGDSPEGGGVGVPAPMPIGGLTDSIVKNLM